MTLSQAFDELEERYGKGSTVLLEHYNHCGELEVQLVEGPLYAKLYIIGGSLAAMCNKMHKEQEQDNAQHSKTK